MERRDKREKGGEENCEQSDRQTDRYSQTHKQIMIKKTKPSRYTPTISHPESVTLRMDCGVSVRVLSVSGRLSGLRLFFTLGVSSRDSMSAEICWVRLKEEGWKVLCYQ